MWLICRYTDTRPTQERQLNFVLYLLSISCRMFTYRKCTKLSPVGWDPSLEKEKTNNSFCIYNSVVSFIIIVFRIPATSFYIDNLLHVQEVSGKNYYIVLINFAWTTDRNSRPMIMCMSNTAKLLLSMASEINRILQKSMFELHKKTIIKLYTNTSYFPFLVRKLSFFHCFWNLNRTLIFLQNILLEKKLRQD